MRPLMALGLALLAVLLAAAAPEAARAQVPCPPPLCEPEPDPTPTPTPDPDDDEPDGEQPPPGPPPPAPEPVSGTTTYQANPGHTGWVPRTSLIAPLRPRWSRRLRAGLPLAGDGRIFVVGDGALRALDPRTGKDLWAVPTSGALGAYDAGRVFVTAGGFLNAYEAATGRQLWAVEVDDSYSLSTWPVATGGVVYMSTDSGTSAILAIDAATGKVRWRARGNGTGNTPAVDADRVYASYACGWTYAWDRAGGKKRWNSTADCSGGGGSTPVVADGRLYVPENSAVYEAATGKVLGTYPGGMPVVADGVAIYTTSVGERAALQAVDPASGRLIWSARPPSGAGPYEGTSAAPLAIGSAVYGIREGVLSGHAVRTGQLLWTYEPERDEVAAYAGGEGVQLGASQDLLLVAGAKELTAFESAFEPAPGGIDIGATSFSPFVGQSLEIGGLVGSELRGRVGRVAVETDRAPFEGRYRPVRSASTNADGVFFAPLKPDRSVRVRVTGGGVRSDVLTIAVLPRYSFAFRAAGRRIKIRFTIRGPRSLRLAGRRAYVYLGRMKSRRYQRLGSARLRQVRRGRSAGAIVVRPPRGVGGKDVVTLCVPGQVRLGMGAPDVLNRRCGARSVRWRRR